MLQLKKEAITAHPNRHEVELNVHECYSEAEALCLQGLAKSIAWDGEGATCLLEVTALGAPDDRAAAKIAKSIAASSLTKAAVFGHDPNWGRIACAAG